MDRRAKLEALAKKKREEREAEEQEAKKDEIKKKHISKPKQEIKLAERVSGVKRPTPIPKNKIYHRVEPVSKPSGKGLFGRENEDTYDDGDGFVVDSEGDSFGEEEEEEEEDFSNESEDLPKRKKEKKDNSKKVGNKKEVKKKKKKAQYSDSEDGSDNEDEEITLEQELDELDTSVIIKSGPGRRTRSSR